MPYETDYKDYWQNYSPGDSEIDKIMNKLIGQQQMIKATLQEVREDVEGEIEYNRTQITQTADEIRQEVEQITEGIDGEFVEVYSTITQTAGEIRSEVEAHVNTLEGDILDSVSLIEQTATDIRSEVATVESNLEGDISDAWSQINQNASSITTKVSQSDYTGNRLVSMINQTASNITIAASKIDLVGKVTFSDLDSNTRNTINSKTDSNQVTTIVGNTVTASYIEAREIARVGRDIYLGNQTNYTTPKRIYFNDGAYIAGNRDYIGAYAFEFYSNVIVTGPNRTRVVRAQDTTDDISLRLTEHGIVVRNHNQVVGSIMFG